MVHSKTKAIRIAIVSPAMNCGGAENSILRLGKYLQEQGYEVEIVTTYDPGVWFPRVHELGLRGYHISGAHKSHPIIHSIRVGLRLAIEKYDIVFLNNAERYAQSALGILPSGVIVAPMIRSDNDQAYEVGCLNHNAWNAVIAVSPKIWESVKVRMPGRSVVLVKDGIEIPAEDTLAKRRGYSRPIQLAFIGRFEHVPKGVFYLPEIMKRFRDRKIEAVLTLVGDGKDQDSLEEKATKLGVKDLMRFKGTLPSEGVYKCLLDAHILLMPSLFEGLPGAPLEAQACGCVPIVSRLPGVSDVVVEDGKTGFLVEPGDVDGFVARAIRLYEDQELWTSMSEAGREKVCRDFTIETMGQNYIRFISEALGGQYPLPLSRKRLVPIYPRAFRWWELMPACLLNTYRSVKALFVPSYEWRPVRRGHK